MLVDERKWMTPEEFNDAYALCNFLPGPNIVNLAVVFGRQHRAARGARSWRCSACSVRHSSIVTFFGLLYARYGDIDALQRMFAGVAAAAAGLTSSAPR